MIVNSENTSDFRCSAVEAGFLARTRVLAFLCIFTPLLGACSSPPAAPSTAPPSSPTPSTAAQPHESNHAVHDHHHRFNNPEKWSKVFDDPARDEWQKPARVIEVMAIAPGMTAADVGAGTGYFLPHLSRAVGPTGKVIGEDIEPDMVKWIDARAKKDSLANVAGLLGTADDPKLPQSAVDRVLVVDTWHHVADRKAFAAKLSSSLKPQGQIYVVDFTMESPHGPPKHARLLPEAIAQDFMASGLETVVVKDAGLPHQYIVRATKR
jgi:ubiquinone/menaquinone biosynthesis C-methylase UbiE